MTVPSILIELDRCKEAEELIKRGWSLVQKTKKDQTIKGIFNLMLGSMSVHS